jgi:hypothetical protein
MVGYSFLDDSFIRNSMPVYLGLSARLDVSIPSAFSGQRGYAPRFLDMAPLI